MELTSSEPKILPTALPYRSFLSNPFFSWEEPNLSGNGNQYSPQDTANFLAFLRELRAQPAGRHLYISAAVPVWTFSGPDGKPSKDLSGFAGVFDHIAIMNYDINVHISHLSHQKSSDNPFSRVKTLLKGVSVQTLLWMTLVVMFRPVPPPRPLRLGLMPVSLRTRSCWASLPSATTIPLNLRMPSTALEI